MKSVLLMPDDFGKRVCELASAAGVSLQASIVIDLPSLISAYNDPPELLLSFGTGVIVPSSLIELTELFALNVHSAPPEYPGRDPHHFAAYDGVSEYGATLHHMSSKVDAGPIIDVELRKVAPDVRPIDLLNAGNQAGWMLVERLFKNLALKKNPVTSNGLTWGSRKTTRTMFTELCRIDAEMSASEIKRRIRATSMPGYSNLYIELHGHRFFLEGNT